MMLENLLTNRCKALGLTLGLAFGAVAPASAAGITVDGWWGLDTASVAQVKDAKTTTYKISVRMAEGAIFKLQKEGAVVSSSKAVLSPAVAAVFKWETGSDGVTPALRFTGKGRRRDLFYITGNGMDTIALAKSSVFENELSVPNRTLVGAYPRRIVDSKESGSVTISIKVSKAGYVEAVSIQNADGITNPHVRNEILSDALHLRFSTGNAEQFGTVVYNITAEDYNLALAEQRKKEAEEKHRLNKQEAIRKNANSKVANAFSNSANSFELPGRTLAKAMPEPAVVSTKNGWVEVNITVDNDGNVTNASIGRRSTELNDEALFNAAISAAKNTKFNTVTNTDMPNQLGKITYHFSAK